jgi:3D (Asp-Asp-Asp) domain-containing protein
VVVLVLYSTPQFAPTLKTPFSRFHLTLPTIVQTTHSEKSKKITEKDLLEAENLVNTASGIVSFKRKLSVFATSYDKYCQGCNEITATGMKAGYGVIAVDPKLIPLGSKVYVPGYGVAVAGDTGGAIKGNKIDLGFDDIRKGWWSSRFVDIYILK